MSTPADLPASDPDVDRPHKPADDREEVYFEGCPAFRWELMRGWFWLLLGLVFIVGPIVLKVLKPDVPWWVIPIGLLLGLIFLLVPWIKTKTMRYKVSNYRIDFETGLISKKFDTLELWHVEDIQLDQPVMQRILGVGTICIHSNDDTTPHLFMSGIPSPRPIFESLKQRIIAVKRQRGVIKMDTGGATEAAGGMGHG
jgi:membrane protein YdbS with pleckstrin-like domain